MTLSPREVEVFQLIKSGLFDEEIANQLGISPKTVCVHKTHIHDKLNLEPRTTILQGLARLHGAVINSTS